MILGIDIGGANTKAASADGKFVHSTYLPLWRECDLKGGLKAIKSKAGMTEAVGVTITGELADCYESKKEGVEQISAAVKEVFPGAVFFGCDGKFYEDTSEHRLFSASNWMASALFLGRAHKDIIFIDCGSTTTDIIPVKNNTPVAGASDFERLSRGELIYTGALRTNVAAILKNVTVKGMQVRVSSELFAISADAYRMLGLIKDRDYTCDTPDGGPKDKESCARRLARVVCCDLEELSPDEARMIAMQVMDAQAEDVRQGILEVATRHSIKKAAVCGLGSFIVKKALLSMDMPFTILAGEYGEDVSRVFPSYAVASLLETEISGRHI